MDSSLVNSVGGSDFLATYIVWSSTGEIDCGVFRSNW